MSWHVEEEKLAGYARGQVDEARAFSIEAHLLACERCRALLTPRVGDGRLERVWADVNEALDAPRVGPVEWLLVRLGVRENIARLLAATPSLRLSWFVASAIALGFAIMAAYGGRGDPGLLVFLVVAPLLPVAGVAAAFGPAVDPTHEVAMAAPMGSFRLVLIRATAVLASTTILAIAAGLALPHLDWTVAAWALPALGLTLCSLALATVAPPLAAAGTVTFLWLGGIVAYGFAPGPVSVDRIVAFRPVGQFGFLVLAIAAALVVASRRDRFDVRART